MADKLELQKILEPVGQQHLLKYWDELDENQQEQLAGQIKEIDWPTITQWALDALKGESVNIPFDQLNPAPYHALQPENADEDALQQKACARGEEMLKAGQVAGFTVAGGQGTRLGFDGPKGTYLASPFTHKSLFQIFAESILYNQNKYGHQINWYIMTSKINDAATRKFFQDNDFFGLLPEQVMMFTQGMHPAFDMNGKALLESKSSLALSPNGHGGSFKALKDSGALADMLQKGITTLSYWQVDNPMMMVMDPLFLGLHDLTKSDMSSRALIKRSWDEKLGHFCLLDNKLTIVEYSDMPENLAKLQDASGRLAYRAGSPAMHVLSTAFIDRITSGKLALSPHKANKKVPYLAANGEFVKPDKPNAIKLEFFLFDALPLANNPLILEADRNVQFAPVKNKEGLDSPATCREAYTARSGKWLKEAGVESIPLPKDVKVEFSTKTIQNSQDLVELIKSGKISKIYIE